MQRACERGIKQISMIDMASIAYGRRHDEPQDKQTNKKARRQTSKQAKKKEDKQAKSKHKVVSARDKCRFGSDVLSFIVLKYDNTLASKNHAWTCKQACKDA